MEPIGIAKFGIEILGKSFGWWLNYANPVRAQAQRVLDAFEAHDIKRHQIPRLLPAEFNIPMDSFSSASRLKEKLTPEFLNWSAALLAIQRGWLDGTEEHPHENYDVYKNPKRAHDWFVSRKGAVDDRIVALHVLASEASKNPCEGRGNFVVVLEECFAEMDNKALSRYHIISDGWHFEHPPCLISLTCLVAIAESLHIIIHGSVVPQTKIVWLESGKAFVPDVLRRSRGRWPAQDLVPFCGRSEGLPSNHKAIWNAAWEILQNEGLAQYLIGYGAPK